MVVGGCSFANVSVNGCQRLTTIDQRPFLFQRHSFDQVARPVHIQAALGGDIVGK